MKRNFVVNVAGGFVGFVLALLLVNFTDSASALSLNRPAVSQAPSSIVSAPSVAPISATFTYQGQLKTGSNPVSGSCNIAFRLYDNPSAGNLIGSPITMTVPITNGLFTVGLNFGNSAFMGSARWLDIRVRCPAGIGSYTTLAPRQAVTAAPYALAPWVTSSSTLYYNSGNVGIGTNNPSASLSVVESGATEPTAFGVPVGLKVGTSEGTIPFAVRQNAAENSTPGLALFETSDGNLGSFGANTSTFVVGAAASHGLGFNVDGSIRAMTVISNGSIGIGTTTPCSDTKLHVYTGDAGRSCVPAAVRGESSSGYGVEATSNNSIGVDGVSGTSIGVYGQSNSSTGVVGDSFSGTYIFEGYDRNDSYNRRFAVVRATGNVLADGSFTSPADFAEMMSIKGLKDDYTPGDVLVIGPDGKLMLSYKPNAVNLAGVYSAKPGFLGDTEIAAHGIEYYDLPPTQERIAVALLGIVPVKVTDENGPIHPGDLLTTSSTLGHAMKAKPVIVNGVEIYPTGTILGKALESWQQGSGVIKVLITLR